MSELYAQTLKYFHLAITEFLPTLRELCDNVTDATVREEIEDLIEAYEDIDAKIESHGLNYDDPNRSYDGEPDEIKIDIPDEMIKNLARLSHRLLFAWKKRLVKLQRKTYLTDANKDEIYKLENLIWPIEALLKAESYVLGKYANLGPLTFPGETSDHEGGVTKRLHDLLEQIHSCYSLGDAGVLEGQRLSDTEEHVRTQMTEIADAVGNEVFQLKVKKLNSGWRTMLKSGFHNRKTAESKLAEWESIINDILKNLHPVDSVENIVKTIKNRLKTEDLFVESRSQDEDQHLLIGKRDGSPEKAHLIIDGKTGEIRVEDNQQEPTELISKIESVLTLRDGRKIRSTRESLEEISDHDAKRPKLDLETNFSVSGSSAGNFLKFKVKNDGEESAVDVKAIFVADGEEVEKISVAHSISPTQCSPEINYRYTDTMLFNSQISDARVKFEYKDRAGNTYLSGRKLIQNDRADGRFNIQSRPGDYFEE
ncbi:hypothetical protein H6786_00375 [Candidatus Nomurabacteria bacterium]|nr:hypothetical protein [Candidatus Nomurabacteria bacterium]